MRNKGTEEWPERAGGWGGERDAVMSQEQGQKGLSNHPCHMPVMSWMVGPY